MLVQLFQEAEGYEKFGGLVVVMGNAVGSG